MFVFKDDESQRMKERLLRDIEKYDMCEMSVNVSKLVFKYRPMEAKVIDGEFTIINELNELNDFCSANNLKYELNHERGVLKFWKHI
jgi:hypothetical protein